MHLHSAYEPLFNGGSMLQLFEYGNVIKGHNGIMLNFYPGLPQVSLLLKFWYYKHQMVVVLMATPTFISWRISFEWAW